MSRTGAPVYSVAVTTTGGAGVATGSGTINILRTGYVEWVYLDYNGAAPNTTDVTIAFSATPPGGNILAYSNANTDALLFPRGSAVTTAGAAITDSHVPILAGGALTVSVAQCDALTAAVTVYVCVREI